MAAPITTEACARSPIFNVPTPRGVIHPMLLHHGGSMPSRMPHDGLSRTLSAAVPLVTKQVAGSVASLLVRLNGSASDTAMGLRQEVPQEGGWSEPRCPRWHMHRIPRKPRVHHQQRQQQQGKRQRQQQPRFIPHMVTVHLQASGWHTHHRRVETKAASACHSQG
eukprot:CAMPEP_0172809870 /NCGR_PEP_ID=MMETSP1075-20121228/8460_1 /TAXON_ID=2916 /ORGANISM="Ceratium fusus, Strain PA161109" /LENGTH=164 /DNA_ID=CAMNT_0013649113 /DNA_START=48 /DNA_END=540 /DNA_ORIENTATION=-